MKKSFAPSLKKHVDEEIARAGDFLKKGDYQNAFRHLERAHVLGQSSTFQHTRVHFLMLKIGWKMKSGREIFGQIFRIIGASTKTPFGIYPTGNTGGANVSPFKPMPVAEDLREILKQARIEK